MTFLCLPFVGLGLACVNYNNVFFCHCTEKGGLEAILQAENLLGPCLCAPLLEGPSATPPVHPEAARMVARPVACPVSGRSPGWSRAPPSGPAPSPSSSLALVCLSGWTNFPLQEDMLPTEKAPPWVRIVCWPLPLSWFGKMHRLLNLSPQNITECYIINVKRQV